MSRATGVPNMPKGNMNNIPDLPRTTSVKLSVKDGKICK